MKKLLLNIIRLAGFFILFYISVNILIAASTAFTPKVEKLLLKFSAISEYETRRIKELDEWMQQDESRKTGLILGSSTAYMNINPQILSAQTGIDFFNCGSNCQAINYSCIILKHVLAKHKPDYILLDVYPGMWNTITTEAPTEWVVNYHSPHHAFILRMVSAEHSVILWNHYFYSMIKRCMPFAKYMEAETMEHSKYIGNGHVCFEDAIADYKAVYREYTSIKIDNAIALNEIERLCKDNNITLIILMPKMINTYVRKDIIKTTAHFIDVENVADETYYRDSHHMHCDGAERFSYWLAKRVNEYRLQAENNIRQE